MNLKLKAFGKTAGMFAICTIIVVGTVEILNRLPPNWSLGIVMASALGWLFYVVYSFNLAQLESKEKLKELTKGFDK